LAVSKQRDDDLKCMTTGILARIGSTAADGRASQPGPVRGDVEQENHRSVEEVVVEWFLGQLEP